jgi:hypothetical protein
MFEKFEMEMPMKKTSTKLALLVLGAASLSAAMNLPASADDNTPVTGGTVNCSTARDSSGNKHCLWKPKEGDKTGFDQFADECAKLGTGTGGKPAPTPVPKPVATTLTSEGTGTYYSAGATRFNPTARTAIRSPVAGLHLPLRLVRVRVGVAAAGIPQLNN